MVAAGAERKLDDRYWKGAKPQLRVEAHGKCAYCESIAETVAHCDVEHFRPKSTYWWLAYCYDNYLYACQICNQTYKLDQFPLEQEAGRVPAPVLPSPATAAQRREFVRRLTPDPLDEQEGRPWQEFQDACRNERALLLNPYVDDPSLVFAWEVDDTLNEVRLVPRGAAAQPFVVAAEECLGLNRDELLGWRYREFTKLDTFRRVYEAGVLPAPVQANVRDMLRTMTDASSPWAGMCRYFVLDVWQLSLV